MFLKKPFLAPLKTLFLKPLDMGAGFLPLDLGAGFLPVEGLVGVSGESVGIREGLTSFFDPRRTSHGGCLDLFFDPRSSNRGGLTFDHLFQQVFRGAVEGFLIGSGCTHASPWGTSRTNPFGQSSFFTSQGFDHLDGGGIGDIRITQEQLFFGFQSPCFVQESTLGNPSFVVIL